MMNYKFSIKWLNETHFFIIQENNQMGLLLSKLNIICTPFVSQIDDFINSKFTLFGVNFTMGNKK